MLKITFLTLFPNYYRPLLEESIIHKALEKGLVALEVCDFRKYATDKHHKVDDEIYGGGSGMLLKIEPLVRALNDFQGYKILVSPQGKKFDQKIANWLAQKDHLIFLSGRYEGFDERVLNYVDCELSIGDYVLTGGELPSMVMADAILRLQPGVIKETSYLNDSFQGNLLDYPQYTRPASFDGHDVPQVLLEGHHAKIAAWRKAKQLEKTQKNRPDLYERYQNEK